MADRIVGVGILGTIAGGVVTFARPINGNGQTVFAAGDYLLNLSTGTSFTISSLTRDDSTNQNKIDTVTPSSVVGWATSGEYFALLRDSGTTTYATWQAAHTAGSDGDSAIGYPLDTAGLRTTTQWTYKTGITSESDTVGLRNVIDDVQPITASAATDFRFSDFEVHGDTGGVGAIDIAGSGAGMIITVERCILYGAQYNFWHRSGSGTVNVNNCIGVGGQGFVCSKDTNFSFCAIIVSNAFGFWRSGGTVTCNNCISMADNPYNGIITGDYNISSLTDAPGANSIQSVTIDQLYIARYVEPNQPTDYRPLENASSVLQNAGKPVAGVLYDIDGRLRGTGAAGSGTAPNIGPCKNFLGFGGVAPDFPAVGDTLVGATTDGEAGTFAPLAEEFGKLNEQWGEDGIEFTGELEVGSVPDTTPPGRAIGSVIV